MNSKEVTVVFTGGVLFGLSLLSLYRFLLSKPKTLPLLNNTSIINNNNNNNVNNNVSQTNDKNNKNNVNENKKANKDTNNENKEENNSSNNNIEYKTRGGEGGGGEIEEFELGRWVKKGFKELVGNTPIIYLRSLSLATGCIILGKAEFMNGGGSVKDRAAKYMIERALSTGQLKEGGKVVEGTVGSTGIALTLQAIANNCQSVIMMPDDVSSDKYLLLSTLGSEIIKVSPVSIVDPNHYVNKARSYRDPSSPSVFFADQFENENNYKAHWEMTGPEIISQWEETNLPPLSAIVMGAGTGGTLSGISLSLKRKFPDLRTFLVDPMGSGLFHKINNGVMYSRSEAEGTRRRMQTDSMIEGVGINRITKNMLAGLDQIEEAFHCSDEEAVMMSRYLIQKEALFLGGSSALNCVGAVKVARRLKRGSVVLTVLCDGGHRYNSNLYNPDYLKSKNLPFEFPDFNQCGLDFIRPDDH